MKRIFIAGFGGQGVLLIGQMLSYAGMYEDKNVTWMPSYGPEMRGGTANCTVNISDETIASPLITKCDVLIVMNTPSLDKFEDMLVPGGDMFVNTSVIDKKPTRTDVNINYVDCRHLAEDVVGNAKTQNMVMLGAIIKGTNCVDMKTMDKVFEKVLTGGKAKLIPKNIEALNSWSK